MFESTTICGQEFLEDTKKGILKIHINAPYYTAGRRFNWTGTKLGISINRSALRYAIANELNTIQVTVGKDPTVFSVETKVWFSKGEPMKHKGVHLKVLQWDNKYFTKEKVPHYVIS